MPTNEQELLRAARAIARLQTKCRRLRRQLKEAKKELNLERRHFRALGGLVGERRPDIVPSRVFGDGVGHAAEHRVVPASPTISDRTEEFVEGLAEPERS